MKLLLLVAALTLATSCSHTARFFDSNAGEVLTRAALIASASLLADTNPRLADAMTDSLGVVTLFGSAPGTGDYGILDPTSASRKFILDLDATLAATPIVERAKLRMEVISALQK